MRISLSRRHFLVTGGTLSGSMLLQGCGGGETAVAAPAVGVSDAERPKLLSGIQFGDVGADGAIVWSRSDRIATMIVEYDTTDRFANPSRIIGPTATDATDFTTRIDLSNLPAGQTMFVRVSYADPNNGKIASEVTTGQFRTAPSGGMKIFEAMRRRDPDFFIHSGDTIYADSPIAAKVTAENGAAWTNLVTEEVSKVAETLKEFRGRQSYNFMDANLRRFAAQVPQIWQWDDHEVTNNYSASKDLSGDARYTEKNVALLAARGQRAFLEYAPMRWFKQPEEQRVYRKVPYGPLLDVFVLEMRSYRGPNSANRQAVESADTAFLGNAQLDWLVAELARSTATWKVIAADMPLGLVVYYDATKKWGVEAIAQGMDGPPRGR